MEIRHFAGCLDSFANALELQLGGLRGRLNQLGDTWQDHVHQGFEEAFQAEATALDTFISEARDQVSRLDRTAKRLEDYGGDLP